MTPTKRYSLIAAGIVAFIILSPFIVLFVTGTKYDFKTHQFIKTGVIGVKSDPKNAKVYLNGKLKGTTNKVIRFLTPGEYSLEIKKPGYFTWSKNLIVRAQYVTWANLNLDALNLFFDQPKASQITDQVDNFYASSKRIIYLKDQQFNIGTDKSGVTTIYNGTFDHPEKTVQTKLANKYPYLQMLASNDQSKFLLYESDFYGIFDADKNTVTDITKTVRDQAAFPADSQFQASDQDFQFGPDNQLYQLQEGTVYKISWDQNNQEPKKEIALDGVLAFKVTGQAIYFIKVSLGAEGLQRSLQIAQLPNYETTTLMQTLPSFKTAQIYISNRNQLFILGNSTLYSLGDNLNHIADYVDHVYIDNNSQTMIYSSGNEISSYVLNTGEKSLLTRSSQEIIQPQSALEYGWIFYINDNRLQSIESDNRNSQNNYTFASVEDGSKFWLDSDAENIVLLNNGVLQKLQIR